jgi:hypothetical protein
VGTLLFGTQEDITCIITVEMRGGDGEPVCLAYKTSTLNVGAGIYFHDDGYVLKPMMGDQDRYYPLNQAEIREHQTAGTLPTPLPSYSIPFFSYVGGYLLWIVIAVVAAWTVAERKWRAFRRKRVGGASAS